MVCEMEREIKYQQDGVAFGVKALSDNTLKTDPSSGCLIMDRQSHLTFGTFAIMGAGKSRMMGLLLASPESIDTISLVIAPGKGDNARQLCESIRKTLSAFGMEYRVIFLTADVARKYIPRRGDILVTSAEQLVGKDASGKNIKALSSEKIADKSIWSIARNATAAGIEIVVLKDEAHIQGSAYIAWRNTLSQYVGYPLITMEYTATPEDMEKLTDYFQVAPIDAVDAGLVRGLYAQNFALIEEGAFGKLDKMHSGIMSAYARVLFLRKLAEDHIAEGKCNGGECAMTTLPKVIVQADSISQIKEYLRIIEELTGATEENGLVLARYSGYTTKDKNGDDIPPSSINDPESPVIFVVHHDALNEGFDAPCLQVFVTYFDSNSATHAIQGFGRVVRSHGGHSHDNATELNTIYIYSNETHLGYKRFKEHLDKGYIVRSDLSYEPEFRSDLEREGLACSNAFRGDRNLLLSPKRGEKEDLTFASALSEEYAKYLPVTRIDTISVLGDALLCSNGNIADIATATSAPSGKLSGRLAKSHEEVRADVMKWVEIHVVNGKGYGADNRLVDNVISRSLVDIFHQVLEADPSVLASASGIAGFDSTSEEAHVSYALHSSIKHWAPVLDAALSRFEPHPDREKKSVAHRALPVADYVYASCSLSNYDLSEAPKDIAELPWTLNYKGVPFRSRETSVYAPERMAEEYFSGIDGLRWVHKNDKLRVADAMGIAYLYPDGTGSTAYPDYLISRDRGEDSSQIMIVEVKDYADRSRKCQKIARVLKAYSEAFGVPACVMMTDSNGTAIAYLGGSHEVPMDEYLSRDWERRNLPVSHDLMFEIASA